MSIEKLPTNASLRQVMDKFEEISLQDFSNINIIVRSELPPSGKAGQICILSDVPTDNITISSDVIDKNIGPNNIFFLISSSAKDTHVDMSNKNKKIRFYFHSCIQFIGGREIWRESYAYSNGQWIKLTKTAFFIFETKLGTSFTSKWKFSSNNLLGIINDEHIKITTSGYNNSLLQQATHDEVDLTEFNTLIFDAEYTLNSGSGNSIFGVLDYKSTFVASTQINGTASRMNIEIDVSNLTGVHKVASRVNSSSYQSHSGTVIIYNCYLV